ncbi:MAG: glycogen/starch/alpha-glucan phosphorylase [Clostridiales bacterium]|nr:glycogen/starch/alpha-glucan phosphorylase [Clostridiales bacterium]MCD7754077.1 glycogen/starch/alpha-glucan phosphorylase [Clostridiales bacterium]
MHEYSKEELRTLIEGKLRRHYGRIPSEATPTQMFKSCALVIRDIMSANRIVTSKSIDVAQARQVHYLSMEFLMGRSLMKNAYNLGVVEPLTEAIESMGFSAADLFELEPDASLGNGGLGRLAACYLESMTTQEIPATGYSICYQLGLFKQKISDGKQIELADEWLELGDAWLMPRRDECETVRFGGTVENDVDEEGRFVCRQVGYTEVLAVPMDMEIAGYQTSHVNKLRLWDAKSPTPVNMDYYSSGEYLKAVEQQITAETIAKVIYPADDHYEGKSLRLKQQYFFVSATVQSICRKHKKLYGTLKNFHEKHVLQINDTHPTLVIPELMRIFIDQEGYSWDEAWYITTHSVAYTNHTVLAEALEHWPQILVQGLLPRIFQIMCEINDRYLKEVRSFFHGDENKARELAIIWDGDVRMANLCVAACYAVNGVAALHSQILKDDVFHTAWLRTPDKFTNVTNGVDHRRWLSQINPQLDQLIRDVTGSDEYLLHPQSGLKKFEAAREDPSALNQLAKIKRANKEAFADYALKQYGFRLNPDAIFDVQVKRLHEYKRQLLNVMHIIYLYQQIQNGKTIQPRTFLFGAKAAPAYYTAKRIIELINSLSREINNDPRCKDQLQVFFLENYRVSLAEKLMPAAEVSEQISTAGKEASGTGNMKFMMNGALTIGTEDGANVEMHSILGDDNIFIFGLTSDEVSSKLRSGYNSYEYYNQNPVIREVLAAITNGFSDGKRYEDLTNGLLYGNGGQADPYLLLADFESYRYTQEKVAEAYQDQKHWNQMSVSNIARSGIFSSDRSIADYAANIWHVDVRNKS